jgi:hypothetical protein
VELNNPVFFNPGDIKEVHVTYNQDIKGTTLKGLNINPVLLFDGMQYSKRINFDNVKLLLPSGIKKLITSNIKYDSTSYGNRTAYYWNKKIVYPTSLNVRWSTIDADISIKKSVLTEIIKPDEVMIIEVLVENRGNKDARDVVLYDTLSLLRFEPIEPMEDFEIENNMVATWKKQVDILKAKETRKFIYEIILKDPSITALKPAVAIFNNSLIGISTDVEIRDKICGNNICSQNETYEECPQDCPQGKDNHCDPKVDGICDPDCKPGEDPDCREKGTVPSINFGIKAGLNFANLRPSGSTSPVFDWTNRTGFCAGAYLSFKLSDYAAVQQEVLFSRKGLKEDQVITSTFNLDFIEIPLLLKFTLSPGGWISPCLSGGPFVAFKLDDNITTGVSVPPIKKFDYGIAFAGGFDLKLGGNTLTLEARYTMGLKNIADVPAGSSITVKSKVLSFMIGLEF